MKQSIGILIIAAIVSGCSIGKIAPPSERKVEYIEKVPGEKTASYRKALVYFSKSLGDANSAIKVRDEKSAQIIGTMNIQCDVTRPTLVPGPLSAKFTLDFQAKDGKYRLAIEDITMIDSSGMFSSYGQIIDKQMLDSVKSGCLDEINRGILGAITDSKGTEF